MKKLQTPHKVCARSAWNRDHGLKDFPKTSKKSFSAASTTVSEDSVDFSPISEITDRNEDITAPSDIMPSKNITNEAGISSINCFSADESDSAAFTSVEANIAPNNLSNTQAEVLNSLIDASQYMKLMEEITEYVMEDLYRNTLPEEDLDCAARVLSAKNQLMILCFCVWIIGVSAVLLFTPETRCCGPPPS